MQYPHLRYLQYLFSKRMMPADVVAMCGVRGLVPPTEPDARRIRDALGPIPSSWQQDLTKANTSFRRWLRDRNLLSIWEQGPAIRDAFDLLFAGDLRSELEGITLLLSTPNEIRNALLSRFVVKVVPSAEAISEYIQIFWSVGEMSREDLVEFMSVYKDRGKELLAVMEGDLVTAYGLLGLRQKIQAEEFYDNLIAFAHQQVHLARRFGVHLHSGNQLMGVSALARQATDAIEARDGLHTTGSLGMTDEMRRGASVFKMRKIVGPPVVSIDEVQEKEHDLILLPNASFSSSRG